MNLRGKLTTAANLYDNLMNAIINVYNDVMKFGVIDKISHKTEYELFNNEQRVVDGPCYAFVVHGKGPAVGGFAFKKDESEFLSKQISIENNNINNITCWTNEVPAIVENNTVMNDVRGGVLKIVNSKDNTGIAINPDNTYKGNVVADMQMMVARAIHMGILPKMDPLLQTTTNTIDSTIVE